MTCTNIKKKTWQNVEHVITIGIIQKINNTIYIYIYKNDQSYGVLDRYGITILYK